MTANTKVRLPQGGDRLEVDGAGGGAITPANGTQAAAISDVADDLANDANGTAIAAAVNANAAALNDILAALRGVGIIAT